MASFKAKFPVLQELFSKNHRGPFAPPPPSGGEGLKLNYLFISLLLLLSKLSLS